MVKEVEGVGERLLPTTSSATANYNEKATREKREDVEAKKSSSSDDYSIDSKRRKLHRIGIIAGLCLVLLVIVGVFISVMRPSKPYKEHEDEDILYHMRMVQRINENKNLTWKAQYNRFASRLTQISKIVATRPEKELVTMAEEMQKHSTEDVVAESESHLKLLKSYTKPLPRSFDARDRWPRCYSIRSVPNQGGCGSCWAVAATSVMSDRLCISSNGTRQQQLSATDLLTCCSFCGSCNGSPMEFASFVYWRKFGIVSGGTYGSHEGCRPYTIAADCGRPCGVYDNHAGHCERKCQQVYDKTYEEDIIKASKIYSIYSYGSNPDHDMTANATVVQLVKRDIFLHGPILACFAVSEDIQHYAYGVYTPTEEASQHLGHCARLIGWGRDKDDNEFWTFVNSWGRDWGEHGLFHTSIDYPLFSAMAGLV